MPRVSVWAILPLLVAAALTSRCGYASPNKRHIKFQIVFNAGSTNIPIPGTIRIESPAKSYILNAFTGRAESDLVCDDSTNFTATPNEHALVPDPHTASCVSVAKNESGQILVATLYVKMIDVTTAGFADNIAKKMVDIESKDSDVSTKMALGNLDSAIKAKDAGSTAHTAAAVAAILRMQNNTTDADFFSSISHQALGQQLGVHQPLAFDPAQRKLVPTPELTDALVGYAKAKGYSTPGNTISNYSAVFESLSGHSYNDITTKSVDFKRGT